MLEIIKANPGWTIFAIYLTYSLIENCVEHICNTIKQNKLAEGSDK